MRHNLSKSHYTLKSLQTSLNQRKKSSGMIKSQKVYLQTKKKNLNKNLTFTLKKDMKTKQNQRLLTRSRPKVLKYLKKRRKKII